MGGNYIDDLLDRHYGESTGSMRRCTVSELGRGKCTSRPYFIFKIDLVNSTVFLKNQKPATYARIAHAYLSTIDSITQQFGAEPEQTEYQGDGVLALFPERGNTAIDVLSAAVHAHYAVNQLRHVSGVNLHPKIVLHYADLTVAKIGPWSETHRVAIGLPIHTVAKREDSIKPGTIWVSEALAAKFELAFRKRFLSPQYVATTTNEKVLVADPPPLPNVPLNNLFSGFGIVGTDASLAQIMGLGGGTKPQPTYSPADYVAAIGALAEKPTAGGLLGGLPGYEPGLFSLGSVVAPPAPAPRYEDRPVIKQKLDGYELKVIAAYQECKFPLNVLSALPT